MSRPKLSRDAAFELYVYLAELAERATEPLPDCHYPPLPADPAARAWHLLCLELEHLAFELSDNIHDDPSSWLHPGALYRLACDKRRAAAKLGGNP